MTTGGSERPIDPAAGHQGGAPDPADPGAERAPRAADRRQERGTGPRSDRTCAATPPPGSAPGENRHRSGRRHATCAHRTVPPFRRARGARSACAAQAHGDRPRAGEAGWAGGPGAARSLRGTWRAGRLRREPLRRLLPQALVVACLAGGTTAFVADDKSVQLSIDGKPRILHTFADDVAGLLDAEGVGVGRHTVVRPAPSTRLSDGDKVVVRHARLLRLTVDGRRRQVWTTARTVDGALRVLGVRPEGAYVSVSRSRAIARTGLTLKVRTERTVHVRADGVTRTLRTNAATAAEAVRAAGVRLHGRDTLSVPPDSFPHAGRTLTVTRVRIGRAIRTEPIPYPVRRTHDPHLPAGTEVVTRPGRTGTRRVTYATRTVDGVPQTPRRIAVDVVREPRAERVRVGTARRVTRPTGSPAPRAGHARRRDGTPGRTDRVDALNWEALARCESGGRPDAVDPTGTYGGLYQFDIPTWRSLGGRGRPQDAPAAEQTRLAKLLYARRGSAPWPVCGRRLTG